MGERAEKMAANRLRDLEAPLDEFTTAELASMLGRLAGRRYKAKVKAEELAHEQRDAEKMAEALSDRYDAVLDRLTADHQPPTPLDTGV